MTFCFIELQWNIPYPHENAEMGNFCIVFLVGKEFHMGLVFQILGACEDFSHYLARDAWQPEIFLVAFCSVQFVENYVSLSLFPFTILFIKEEMFFGITVIPIQRVNWISEKNTTSLNTT